MKLANLRSFELIFLLLLIGGCTNPSHQTSATLVDRNTFTQMYLDSLEKRNPSIDFQIDSVLVISSADIIHYLDNAYRAYTSEPDMFNKIIADYLDASSDSYNLAQTYNKNLVIPVIKPTKYLDDIKSLGGDLEKELYYHKYNKDLIILYAIDGKHNISYLKKIDIDTLGLESDTLQQFALNNLKRNVPEVELVNNNGQYGILAGGNYEASLILSSKLWNKNNFPVEGEIVIAIPTRDMVYVVGSNNKSAIEKLKLTARESFEKDNYQVSPYLYWYNGKKFERYD